MYNQEAAIQQWLRKFRSHKAFNEASVWEMELHLRDHIDDLVSDGHSEKEAFHIAVKEFGEIGTVGDEEYDGLRRESLLNLHMFRNYLKIAMRSISRQPFFAFLNSFGLSVGMAGALIIGLFILYELEFDRSFKDSDRIYRINIDNQTQGEYKEYASAPGPMGNVLKEDCAQVELVTRFREVEGILLKKPVDEVNTKEAHVAGADANFLKLFGLELIMGDAGTALEKPNTLILTRTAAEKHFGSTNVLGKQLLVNNSELYEVTGVLEDLPPNSFLRDHTVFLALESFEDVNTEAWNTWYFPTFVKLHEGSDQSDLDAFLGTVKENYLLPWAISFVPGLTLESMRASEKETGNFMRFNSLALKDIHLLGSNREGDFSENGDISNVYILAFIGMFLILMASVNFMNLSTAYSLNRAKEVGVRKTLGSGRASLIRQFLSESVLLSCISMIIAVLLAATFLPVFNDLAATNVTIPFGDPWLYVILIISVLGLGLLSGIYPAVFLSRFTPAQSLKGIFGKVKGGSIRSTLVVFQFSISVFLIIGSLVIFQQVNYIGSKNLGFDKDQILILEDVSAAGQHLEVFKEKIKGLDDVESVSLSSFLPTPSRRGGTTYFPERSFEGDVTSSENALIIEQWDIDYEYVNVLDLEMISGRNFSQDYGTDSSALLLNETAVAMLDQTPEEIIGMRLTDDFHRPDKENMEYLTVIGVVKNFHFESMRNGINALSLIIGGAPDKMIIKLTGRDMSETIKEIEASWNEAVQGQPFSFYFMNDSFNDSYKSEVRLGRIFLLFTFLAIFIACLGLFGLAAFNAQKRLKEIGIRKVLGASTAQITLRLTRDFLKLVLIAIVIALPPGWYAMNRWLEEFSYRIELGIPVLLGAAFIAILVAVVTIGHQSIRAALQNPVNGLRSE